MPIAPTEESLQLLLRARLILSHALEHASQKTEFDNMLAILGLDNTVEYILRCIASHLDLETKTGKSFDIIDLASLAATINKTLGELSEIHLPYLGEIKLLRQTRNLVQHGAIAPYADLERFSTITQRFFDKVLKTIFGFRIEELRISSVIDDKHTKEFLRTAEMSIDVKNWLEAIVASRNAFENEYFKRIKHFDVSISLYPILVYAMEKLEFASGGFQTIKEELELSYLGVNSPDYRHFKEYIRHIPHEYCSEDSWGETVMQRAWTKEDAAYCYNFAANTILRWQARDKEKLYTPKLDKEYVFDETIAGINLSKDSEGGCSYYFHDDKLYLFYTTKHKKRLFEKLEKSKIYEYRTVRFVDGEKEEEYEEQIELRGKHIFLATNNPERWGIVIWYRTMEDMVQQENQPDRE